MAKITNPQTKIKKYEKIVLELLKSYNNYPTFFLIVDKNTKHYMLMDNGWANGHYRHNVLLHFHIEEDGKVWIMANYTETLVEIALTDGGIPKTDIVLGMKKPILREYSGYAIA